MRCRCVETDRQRRIARLRNSRKDRDRRFVRTADIAYACICPGYTGRLDCFQESRACAGEEEGVATNTSQLRARLTRVPVKGNARGGRTRGRKMERAGDVQLNLDCSVRGIAY